MTNTTMKTLLIIIVILLNILQTLGRGCTLKQNRIYIHVVNNLPSNSQQLKLRCQSADDDLGYHTLSINQEFEWSFCENVVGSTLFFCHLYWGSKQRVFDVFRSNMFVRSRHTQYYWVAKSDGIYSSHSKVESTYKKMIDWK
ncbi:hypothetical protein CASFOL_029103 [Castilleja foliolosa]|uniref:S-protein homolog n=1 Tax=Castilleja foliolosa TaxID=1961234 RepID=A0ABD3CCY6_9LAMI